MDWLSFLGMQDYNYLKFNTFELTLELGCDKFPAAERLEQFWEDNKPALIAFMEMVCMTHHFFFPSSILGAFMAQFFRPLTLTL